MKKIIIVLILLVAMAGVSYKILGNKSAGDILSPEEARARAEKFINDNLMNPGSQVTIKEITEEEGLYKIVVNAGGQDINSYLTKDGKKFFPQVLDIEETEEANNNTADEGSVEINKSERPKIELFVMSHCPYGTQIEKGILPVLEILGDKIDFTLKFCDYAMHGETELDEQLNQYCIQKEEPTKFISYLQCFLEDGDSDRCLTQTGVDKSKLDACVAAVDKEFKVKEKFADESTWSNGSFPVFDVYKEDNEKYGVGGSPTLVINGGQASSSRDSASLLNTICSGFNEKPEQCNTQLSSTSPSPGFGFGEGGGDTDATCN